MYTKIYQLFTFRVPQASRVSKSLFAIVVGFSMIMVFGFASPELIHDAAHDVRHIMTFPCH
jgi:cobalt transporter subunit CbtB